MADPNGRSTDYFQSASWRTPADLDARRWDILGEFMTDVIDRLDRIEQLLKESPEAERPRRRRKVDDS